MPEHRSRRRLAAILAADVVGYSRLMGNDEAGTLSDLKRHRSELTDVLIAEYQGRIVKLIGDGILVEFASVVNAVACAIRIQREMVERNAEESDKRRIEFRIGIHIGDIIVDDDDIYGDGVNIAARIESIAEPGGVCISGAARDHVGNRLALVFKDLGPQKLKNIDREVRVFAVAPDHAAPRASSSRRATRQGKPTIAVLPFANMSGDPEQEYFSDGITEDVITDLSKISALGVIARNTSFQFKGRNVDVPQIARQLGVDHVLEGSVRRAGGRVRITAQLIEATTGEHVWADRYDREISDIFALQDEISATIVRILRLKLLPGEMEAIEQRSTTNPAAYKLYLMARHLSVKGSVRYQKVIERLCRRALEIDPDYAAAWAQLAIASSIASFDGSAPAEGGMDAADRAIALNPNLADAYSAKGRILADRGQYQEAEDQFDKALRLDPDSYEVNAAAGRCALTRNRYDSAIRYLETAAEASATDFWALGMAIGAYEANGDLIGARSVARRALDRIEPIIADQPDHGSALSFGILALIALDEHERAMEWSERALLLDPDNSNLHYNLACAMVKIGDTDRAIELLAGALERVPLVAMRWIRSDPDLDPIRDEPSFKRILVAAEARLVATKAGVPIL